jgi:hypothetical protein
MQLMVKPWTVFASVGKANQMNKVSLVGMQLPEEYKENFDVSSEGPEWLESLGETSKIPTNESLFIGLNHRYLIYTR